jgi:hypothetical protein
MACLRVLGMAFLSHWDMTGRGVPSLHIGTSKYLSKPSTRVSLEGRLFLGGEGKGAFARKAVAIGTSSLHGVDLFPKGENEDGMGFVG